MESNKLKTILVFIDWFLPGTKAGGPVKSVYSMVKVLNNDFKFKIITTNCDHLSSVPYAEVKSNEWVSFDKNIEVYYCSKETLSEQKITSLIQESSADYYYINSLYSKWFSIVPLHVLKRLNKLDKTVLSPRGMLGQGALKVKPIKKKLFLAYAKLKGLHSGIHWQASNATEKEDIQRVFGKGIKVSVIGNLSFIDQEALVYSEKKKNTLDLFFLSRIVPIKNLKNALLYLKEISADYNVNYTIYGFIEDAVYWKECEQIIQAMPEQIKVTYGGILDSGKVQQALAKHHALYMLTYNENFGHSILESFAAGKPVVISDQTPWNNLSENKTGYNVKVNGSSAKSEALKALIELLEMDQQTYNEWSKNAYEFAGNYLNSNENYRLQKAIFTT